MEIHRSGLRTDPTIGRWRFLLHMFGDQTHSEQLHLTWLAGRVGTALRLQRVGSLWLCRLKDWEEALALFLRVLGSGVSGNLEHTYARLKHIDLCLRTPRFLRGFDVPFDGSCGHPSRPKPAEQRIRLFHAARRVLLPRQRDSQMALDHGIRKPDRLTYLVDVRHSRQYKRQSPKQPHLPCACHVHVRVAFASLGTLDCRFKRRFVHKL